jgi:hypothetical protein
MLKKGQNVKITIDGSYFKKGQIVEVSEPDKYGAWLLGDDKYGSYNDWYFKYGDFDVVDSVVESIIEKFRERSAVGINKYGTTLDRNDLNTDDWLNHLQEEMMDALLYIQKLRYEIKKTN